MGQVSLMIDGTWLAVPGNIYTIKTTARQRKHRTRRKRDAAETEMENTGDNLAQNIKHRWVNIPIHIILSPEFPCRIMECKNYRPKKAGRGNDRTENREASVAGRHTGRLRAPNAQIEHGQLSWPEISWICRKRKTNCEYQKSDPIT